MPRPEQLVLLPICHVVDNNTIIQTTANVRIIDAANRTGLLISSLRLIGPGAVHVANVGIYFDTCTKSRITDIWIEDAGNVGIFLSSCEFIKITDSFIDDSVFIGVRPINSDYIVVDNVAAASTVAGAVGFDVGNCTYCKFNSCYADLNVNGIWINTGSNHNVIHGCTFINNTGTGILIDAGNDRNNVTSNMVVGNTVAQITDNGANNNLDNNQVL